MPLNAKAFDSLYPLVVNDWNPIAGKLNAILLDSVNNSSYSIDYPLRIEQDTEAFQDSQIFLFKNRFGSREDQYYELRISENRIGVIFPIKVFSDPSNLPMGVDEKFVYRFLYISFYHLLHANNVIANDIDQDKLNNIDRPLKIEDFYDEETVVLLYHNSFQHGHVFNIKSVFPSLFKFGYVPILTLSDFFNIQQLSIPAGDWPLSSYSTGSTLRLDQVKGDLLSEPYISQLFESTLKVFQTPLVKFILLYQVVELLINRIGLEFYRTNDPHTGDFNSLFDANRNANSYRDLIENIEAIKSKIDSSMDRKEEKRIRKLFDDRCKLFRSHYPKLEVAALAIIPDLTGNSVTDILYPIRNKIVHGYHVLSSQYTNIDGLLDEYNLEFEKLTADIVISFI